MSSLLCKCLIKSAGRSEVILLPEKITHDVKMPKGMGIHFSYCPFLKVQAAL